MMLGAIPPPLSSSLCSSAHHIFRFGAWFLLSLLSKRIVFFFLIITWTWQCLTAICHHHFPSDFIMTLHSLLWRGIQRKYTTIPRWQTPTDQTEMLLGYVLVCKLILYLKPSSLKSPKRPNKQRKKKSTKTINRNGKLANVFALQHCYWHSRCIGFFFRGDYVLAGRCKL